MRAWKLTGHCKCCRFISKSNKSRSWPPQTSVILITRSHMLTCQNHPCVLEAQLQYKFTKSAPWFTLSWITDVSMRWLGTILVCVCVCDVKVAYSFLFCWCTNRHRPYFHLNEPSVVCISLCSIKSRSSLCRLHAQQHLNLRCNWEANSFKFKLIVPKTYCLFALLVTAVLGQYYLLWSLFILTVDQMTVRIWNADAQERCYWIISSAENFSMI